MTKTLSLLGLCRKAGMLLPGHDIVFDAVRTGKAKLVLLTSDASQRHEKELKAAGYAGVTVRVGITSDDIAPSVGKKSCVFAVTDSGFAKAIEKKIREEGIQYECSSSEV